MRPMRISADDAGRLLLELKRAESSRRCATWIAVRASLRAALDVVTLADVASGELPAAVRTLADGPASLDEHASFARPRRTVGPRPPSVQRLHALTVGRTA
jgi:hypothetical protein